MDLALNLGMTEAQLRRSMSERELHRWEVYASRRLLPWRRTELMLAQVAMRAAQAFGGFKDAKLADFLFEPQSLGATTDDVDDEVISPEDLSEQFGGRVLVRKQKGMVR